MAPRICTPEEAAALVRTTDTVGFGLGPGQSRRLPHRAGRPGRLGRPHVRRGPPARLLPGPLPPQRDLPVRVLRPGRADDAGRRGQHRAGPRWVPPVRPHPAAVQPPGHDRAGRPAGRTARQPLPPPRAPPTTSCCLAGRDPDRLLVVEVNPNLPRTCSLAPDYTNTLPLDIVDVLVEADGRAVHPAPRRRPTTSTRPSPSVARSFVADGATLQIGIGAVPNMVATKLAEGPGGGYGVHSRDVHRRADAAPPGRQGHQRRQGPVQRGVGHHVRPRVGRALPLARRQRRRGLRARRRWSTTRR